MRKLILVTIIIFLGAAQYIPHLIEKKQRQQILAATVMITITVPNWLEKPTGIEEALPIPNDEYRTIARAEGEVISDGLGTLVINGDERLLVTHDHWSRFDEVIGTVAFRAADGTPLTEMDLRAFKQYLRYRDGGTMVLTAPEVLSTAVSTSAKIMDSDTFKVGDNVFLAQRAGNRVTVTKASVITQTGKEGLPAVQLQSAAGQVVVGGDSGGGVWLNGRLAATMWTTIMMENSATGERRATDLSIAAIYNDNVILN